MSNIINIGYKDAALITPEGNLKLGFPFFSGPKYAKIFVSRSIFQFEKAYVEEKAKIKFPFVGNDWTKAHTSIDELDFGVAYSDTYLYPLSNVEYKLGIISDFIKNKENFYIPVNIMNEDLFDVEQEIIEPELAEYIRAGHASFLFQFPMEGFFGQRPECFAWLHKFIEINNFPKTAIIFICSNMIIKQSYQDFLDTNSIESKITFVPYNYFENDLWFVQTRNKLDRNVYVDFHTRFKDNLIEERKSKIFYKHFSFLSRRIDMHRLVTFGFIKTNGNLNRTTLSSFYNPYNIPNEEIHTYLTYDYWKSISNYVNIVKFVNSTDFSVPFLINNSFREGNQVNLAQTLDMHTHNAALISIITESLTEPTSVFFSEKTFKSIYTLNPFFIIGNPYSLRELKKLGYKTFDRWWDESYDEEVDLANRLNKAYETYQTVAEWSIDKLNEVYQEMQPVLLHNFNQLLSTDGITSLTSTIQSHYNNLKSTNP